MLSAGLSFIFSPLAMAQQKKLDLDDMIIKGELLNDDRLIMLSRQRNDLKNIVKFRESYQVEILQQLPETRLKRKFD